MHTTSGTTGAPQPVLFGAWDREVQNCLLARAYLLQGLRADDIVHSVYGFGMINGGHYIREALIHFTECLVLPAGTGLETRSEQQVELMRTFGATVLVGFVDYIRHLAQVARDQGIEPGRDVRIRMISGHVGPGGPRRALRRVGRRRRLRLVRRRRHRHHRRRGTRSRRPLRLGGRTLTSRSSTPTPAPPRPDGESGNLCVTVLFKDGVAPIVRFDTQDVSAFVTTPPASDIAFRRIRGFQGRSDQMVKLRGINVYPTAIGAHLGAHPAATGEYVCRVARHGHRDEMTVVVEVRPGAADAGALRRQLEALLHGRLGVEVAVELVGPGETAALTQIQARQKPIRLVDGRAG